MVMTYYRIFPDSKNYLLHSLALLANLQNGADGIAGSEASHVGSPGSGALEAPGGERGSGTMSGLSGPLSWPGPRPCALLLLFLLGPSSVLAISFHLPVNSRKCLREEIHKDLLVTGAYEITDQSGGAGGLRTHLKVRRGGGRPDGRRRAGEAEVVGRPAGGGRGLACSPPPPQRSGRAVRTAPSPRALGFAGRGCAPKSRARGRAGEALAGREPRELGLFRLSSRSCPWEGSGILSNNVISPSNP